MRIRGSKTTALAVAAAGLFMSAAAANAVNLTVGSGGPVGPGGSVSISVTLQSEGSAVAGTQNDIAFAPEAAIRASSAGKPLCSVNPAIDKSATAFSFQPPQCTVGTTCTAIRALVLSLSNVDAIPDGSVLYNCDVAVAADAPDGDYPLTCSGAGSSDPDGVALTTTCTNGTVTVEPVVATQATIIIGNAAGEKGGTASVGVSLEPKAGVEVAGTQNDIAFVPDAAIRASSAGKPLCSVNPAIDKSATAFSFQPPRCTVGTDCTAIRALVLSLSNVDPIPDGSNLYNCDIAIGENAAGVYPLTCSGAGSSDPAGVALQTACTDGAIAVVGATNTPTVTPTNTPTITAAVPPTTTRTTPPTAGPGGDVDDGCAITAPAQSQAGWLLVFPAAMLLWLRRRSR